MNYYIEKVKKNDASILFRLLQFALYDGSQYIDNEITNEGIYEYKWFDNYFSDNDRDAFFIKSNDNKIIGFVMINSNMKLSNIGHSIAEFLIFPKYRRKHIGKKIALEILSIYRGIWEIEPISNNDTAYYFWENVVKTYTNNNFFFTDNIFVFNHN